MDTLSDISFRPVLYKWCNKECGKYSPVCGMVHIKDPLMLLSKGNPGSGSSMSSLTLIAIFPMTENHKKLIFLFDFMELSHSLKGLPIVDST